MTGAGGRAEPGRRSFIVGDALDGVRLDRFIGQSLKVSAAAARRLIDADLVRVEGRPATKGSRLSGGMVVDVREVGAAAFPVVPDGALDVTVVYADAHLVAIDKPAGVPSHPLRPAETGTAANAIVARFPECAGASLDPREGGLGHRLDTATTGVLIAARSRAAWVGLRRALAAEDCEKQYLCEVWGAPPAVGRVNGEIGRQGRRGRVVRVGGGGRQPRPAETSWTLSARGERTSLIEARLHAGRAHQVRAHLASAGFPIVGDDRYGGAVDPTGAPARSSDAISDHAPPDLGSRLHLHAARVQLRHPVTGAIVVITAPSPTWARRLLDGAVPVG